MYLYLSEKYVCMQNRIREHFMHVWINRILTDESSRLRFYQTRVRVTLITLITPSQKMFLRQVTELIDYENKYYIDTDFICNWISLIVNIGFHYIYFSLPTRNKANRNRTAVFIFLFIVYFSYVFFLRIANRVCSLPEGRACFELAGDTVSFK